MKFFSVNSAPVFPRFAAVSLPPPQESRKGLPRIAGGVVTIMQSEVEYSPHLRPITSESCGVEIAPMRFIGIDPVLNLQRQSNIVKTFKKALLSERINIEMQFYSVVARNHLLG